MRKLLLQGPLFWCLTIDSHSRKNPVYDHISFFLSRREAGVRTRDWNVKITDLEQRGVRTWCTPHKDGLCIEIGQVTKGYRKICTVGLLPADCKMVQKRRAERAEGMKAPATALSSLLSGSQKALKCFMCCT